MRPHLINAIDDFGWLWLRLVVDNKDFGVKSTIRVTLVKLNLIVDQEIHESFLFIAWQHREHKSLRVSRWGSLLLLQGDLRV